MKLNNTMRMRYAAPFAVSAAPATDNGRHREVAV